MRHQQEAHLPADVAVVLVLARAGAQGDEEENVPRHANLKEHLEVEPTEHARVQLGAHEEIIHVVARHAVTGVAREGGGVGDNGDDEAGEDGDAHQRAELVDQGVEPEGASDVESDGQGNCEVERGDSRAVVVELLAAEVLQWLSLCVYARHIQIADAFEDEKRPVHDPRS